MKIIQSPQSSLLLQNYFLFLYQSNYDKIKIKDQQKRIKKPRGTIRQSIILYLLFNFLTSILYHYNNRKDKMFVKKVASQLLRIKLKTFEWNEWQLKQAIRFNFNFEDNLDNRISFLSKFNSSRGRKNNLEKFANESQCFSHTSKSMMKSKLKKLILFNRKELEKELNKNQSFVEILEELLNFSKKEITPNAMKFLNSLFQEKEQIKIAHEIKEFRLILLISQKYEINT